MRRSCLVLCAAAFLLVLAGLYVGGYYVGKLRLLAVSPRLDTTGPLPEAATVVVWLDGTNQELYRLLQRGTGGLPPILLKSVLPHEMSLALTPAGEEVRLTAAISTRGLTDMLEDNFSRLTLFSGLGFPECSMEREGGLMTLRAARTVPPEALAEAVTPILPGRALEQAHDLEIKLDNRGGGVAQALWPLFGSGEMSSGAGESEPLASSLWLELQGVLRHMESARLTVNFSGQEALTLHVTVSTSSERDAQAAMLYLSLLRDNLYAAAVQQHTRVDGAWSLSGTEIEGHFTITGYDPLIAGHIRGILS